MLLIQEGAMFELEAVSLSVVEVSQPEPELSWIVKTGQITGVRTVDRAVTASGRTVERAVTASE